MNWFLYIGGGMIFWLIGCGLMKNVVDLDKTKGTKGEDVAVLFVMVPPLLVWIWICWKFI